VLGTAVTAPIVVIVAEVPWFAGFDWLAAPPADHVARSDGWGEASAPLLVCPTVASRRGRWSALFAA
jgi:hypothetical protein